MTLTVSIQILGGSISVSLFVWVGDLYASLACGGGHIYTIYSNGASVDSSAMRDTSA